MACLLLLLSLYFSVCRINSDSISVEKRSHNHGPSWLDECWDYPHVNPMCDLLTSSTSTTTQVPTTTPRSCNYQVYNDSNINNTDYVPTVQGVQSSAVHVTQNLTTCQTLCERSLLQNSYECWAFTYNYRNISVGCYLYYYQQPVHYVSNGQTNTGTTLYLKRCSDDPFGNVTYTPPPTKTVTSVTSVSGSNVTVATTKSTTTATTTSRSTGTGSTQTVIVESNSFRIQGVNRFGSCDFLGQTFSAGDTWKDTCRYQCECTDAPSNIATCIDICPFYPNISSTCQIVKQPGVCCTQMDCSGTSTTVSPRTCTYDAYNDSDITDTDFTTGLPLREDTNITLNEPVFLNVDQSSCEMMCSQSVVHVRFECRAYTFGSNNSCHMYHYYRPLSLTASSSNETGTSLHLKRCSDDHVIVPVASTVPP